MPSILGKRRKADAEKEYTLMEEDLEEILPSAPPSNSDVASEVDTDLDSEDVEVEEEVEETPEVMEKPKKAKEVIRSQPPAPVKSQPKMRSVPRKAEAEKRQKESSGPASTTSRAAVPEIQTQASTPSTPKPTTKAKTKQKPNAAKKRADPQTVPEDSSGASTLTTPPSVPKGRSKETTKIKPSKIAPEEPIQSIKSKKPRKLQRRPPLISFGRHECTCDRCIKKFEKRGIRRVKGLKALRIPSVVISPVEDVHLEPNLEVERSVSFAQEAAEGSVPIAKEVKKKRETNRSRTKQPVQAQRDLVPEVTPQDNSESPETPPVPSPPSITKAKRARSPQALAAGAEVAGVHDPATEMMRQHINQVKERVSQIKVQESESSSDEQEEDEVNEVDTVLKKNEAVTVVTVKNSKEEPQHDSIVPQIVPADFNKGLEEIAEEDEEASESRPHPPSMAQAPAEAAPVLAAKAIAPKARVKKATPQYSGYAGSAPPIPLDDDEYSQSEADGTSPQRPPERRATIAVTEKPRRKKVSRTSTDLGADGQAQPQSTLTTLERRDSRRQPEEEYSGDEEPQRYFDRPHNRRKPERNLTADVARPPPSRRPSRDPTSRSAPSSRRNSHAHGASHKHNNPSTLPLPPSVAAAAAQGAFLVTHGNTKPNNLLTQFGSKPLAMEPGGGARTSRDRRVTPKGYARLEGDVPAPRSRAPPPPKALPRPGVGNPNSQDRFTSLLARGASKAPPLPATRQVHMPVALPNMSGAPASSTVPHRKDRVYVLDKHYTKWDTPV